jgi:hypothetical protein
MSPLVVVVLPLVSIVNGFEANIGGLNLETRRAETVEIDEDDEVTGAMVLCVGGTNFFRPVVAVLDMDVGVEVRFDFKVVSKDL